MLGNSRLLKKVSSMELVRIQYNAQSYFVEITYFTGMYMHVHVCAYSVFKKIFRTKRD
jgi:hypothetical protein